MPLAEVQKLLKSRVHEHRAVALRILVLRFEKGSPAERERVFKLYLASTKWVNNWDLVDLSAPDIVGAYLLERDRKILYELANSCNLWERRIAIISTYAFIRDGDYSDTLKIAEILLNDGHDLVHKAVGWMLREIGNRDLEAEEKFLKRHACSMPRVMLRYAIEKFPNEKREFYLKIKNLAKLARIELRELLNSRELILKRVKAA